MTENTENTSDVKPCCDEGSCCPSDSDGAGKNWKIMAFIIIVIAAGAVLANSLIRKSNADADQSQQTFASIQLDNMSDTPSPVETTTTPESPIEAKSQIESPPVVETTNQDVPVIGGTSLWGTELESIASLNKLATDTDAVFVFLAAKDQLNDQAITRQIEAAAKIIKADGVRVSAFRLKQSAADYAHLAKQVSTPSVLAMVKGRGTSVVSGEITETKLVQAFVAASRPGGGCCPSGSTTCPPTGPRK
jgi:hypothetical protein